MFWNKTKDERIEDGVKFAVLFLIMSITATFIFRSFDLMIFYLEMIICKILFNLHLNHKYYKEFNTYSNSIEKLKDIDHIDSMPTPLDMPEDKGSRILYLSGNIVATILACMSIFVQFNYIWGGGVVNYILSALFGIRLGLDLVLYITKYKKLMNMRLAYMDIYIRVLMMRHLHQFRDLFETKLKR